MSGPTRRGGSARFPLGAVLLVLAFGCAATGSAAMRPAPRTHSIAIQGFVFRPDSVVAAVGDTLEWVNADAFDHSAVAMGKQFDSGVLVRGAKAVFVPSDTGSYPYRCNLHPTMAGTIIVR